MEITYELLLDTYNHADEQLDVEGRAACIAEMLAYIRKYQHGETIKKMQKFLASHFQVIFLAMMQCIVKHQGKQAEYYLTLLAPEKYEQMNMLPAYHYWLGRALYEQEKWEMASREFQFRVKQQPDDELAWFFLGNCYVKLLKYMNATMAYHRAISINRFMSEAKDNLECILLEMNKNFQQDKSVTRKELVWQLYDTDIIQFEDNSKSAFNLPIFINSRDRVLPLRMQINWLLKAGYNNIHILDNDSTYPELLNYYEHIRQQGVNVWQLDVNFGHKALWESKLLNILNIDTPYVYTDSDVVPDEQCPQNLLEIMLGVLYRNRYLKKIGLSLHIDDITYYNSEFIRKIESQMKSIRIEDGYFQSTDTTFALYRNLRHYSIRESFRTIDGVMGRHIPWYYDYDNLPADEIYYMKHANNSSTLSYLWKQHQKH